MHEIIRRIEIPPVAQTNMMEERELFAKMVANQRKQARAARRARLLSLLGWRRGAEPATTRRRKTAPPIPGTDSAGRTAARSR